MSWPREALSKVFLLLLKNFPAPPRTPTRKAVRDDERVKLMMQYIRDHYSEDIRIEDLCRRAAISESECLRCFRATIGTTPMQYVRDYRMDVAATMLLETDLSAGEIGGQCGFSDPSYFPSVFGPGAAYPRLSIDVLRAHLPESRQPGTVASGSRWMLKNGIY